MSARGKSRDSHQLGLIELHPAGFALLKQLLDRDRQEHMIGLARALVKEAPLYTPRNRWGADFRLQITSWGEWGWHSDTEGARYIRTHPETGRPWPKIPREVRELMKEAAGLAGVKRYEPDTVLVNFYKEDDDKPGRLGLHQDKTERNQEAPIVTLSLGASCVFGLGGLDYNDPVQEIPLDGGDVVVMDGPARMLYHTVDRILKTSPPTSAQLRTGGRISFTARRYL